MSVPEVPADTEARQILAALSAVGEKIDLLTQGINSLGANQQWLVDNVQGLFQMFSSPHFMGQIQQMLMGGAMSADTSTEIPVDAEVVEESPDGR